MIRQSQSMLTILAVFYLSVIAVGTVTRESYHQRNEYTIHGLGAINHNYQNNNREKEL